MARPSGSAPPSSARQADDVQELIAKLGHDLDSAARHPGRRRRATKKNLRIAGSTLPRCMTPAGSPRRLRSLPPRSQLPLPVNGVRIREFGASDGLGGTEKGLSIATRPGAQVTAPCDGWVVYAGPFRNYGQLLILNAGGGYHVLLAGMERISVDLGQFVVTGEPVAVMGGRVQVAAALTRRIQANLCCMSNSGKTGPPSIQAHGGRQAKAKRFADDAQNFPHSPRCSGRRGLDAASRPSRGSCSTVRARRRRPPTPTGSSACSAMYSSGCAPTTSRSRTTASWSNRRSTACWPGSTRIRATWTPRASATCRCRPAASSAVSASKSRWRTA